MKKTVTDLKVGESGKIQKVTGNSGYVRRLSEMGFTPGTVVTLKKKAPLGDPLELEIREYVLTIRKSSASLIFIE